MRVRRPLRLQPHVHMTLERLPEVVETMLGHLRCSMTPFVIVRALQDLDAFELVEHGNGVGGDAAVGLVKVDSVPA